jgi:hypothetical protein
MGGLSSEDISGNVLCTMVFFRENIKDVKNNVGMEITWERSEKDMRCIVECVIPVDTGNRSILDGTLPLKIKKYLEAVKPEAVYFTVKDGQRTMFAVVNFPSEDKMVAFNEPLWLDWGAAVTVTPAMSLADLEKAGKDMEQVAKERR